MKPAVFLDRDGTIIEQVHYLADPSDVRLIPGSAVGIRRLQEAGYACVMITNQSAIGRGMLSLEGYEAVHAELIRQLQAENVRLDGTYMCPIAPSSDDRTRVEHGDRKPGPGMLERAARELELDLAQSWVVGDMISDALAGRNAGCRASILVRTGYGAGQPLDAESIDHVVDDLHAAAEFIIECGGGRNAFVGGDRQAKRSTREP